MKIVALDTQVTDFDRLDWTPFSSICNFIKYDRSEKSQILERSAQADGVIINKVIFDNEIIKELPKLRYIGVFATGTNNVDLDSAKKHNVTVTNVTGYSKDAVAQHTMAFIYDFAAKVSLHSIAVKQGEWSSSRDFCFFKDTPFELSGRTLGLIGYGDIAKKVEKIAHASGMAILKAKIPGRVYNDERTDLDELLKRSDIVSLHCPLSPITEKLINRETLSLMKPSSLLINTSRGGLVDECALYEALEERKIAHACLDVLQKEPPDRSNKLVSSRHCTITPHMAWGAKETRQRLLNEAALNLKFYLENKIRNRIT